MAIWMKPNPNNHTGRTLNDRRILAPLNGFCFVGLMSNRGKHMSGQMCRRDFLRLVAAGSTGVLAGYASGATTPSGGKRWYRGNLHMHTYWSDGRAFPEQAVSIYKNKEALAKPPGRCA